LLFNSYEFLFLFLPVTLAGFFLLGHYLSRRLAMTWLVMLSLIFYAWWNPYYLILITASITINYMIGRRLQGAACFYRKRLIILGVGFNLTLLGYFKYVNFFVDNLNILSGQSWVVAQVALPLGISFITFQQIAFLVDAYRGGSKDPGLLNYSLFVSFFPQLIAGPIVHHKEMMDQFVDKNTKRFSTSDFVIGFTIFTFGLAKKMLIADSIAPIANQIFDHATDLPPNIWDAWFGALAYTLQLYFDFSGYSDMAIGLGRMFNITLPINFNSPYKSRSIIEFWRRWHITLSRFLRDYLYVPLGGNRTGPYRLLVNLWIVMLLGGLWHGAGWTFVVWGALHAFCLCINHLWSQRTVRWPVKHPRALGTLSFLSWGVTFTSIVIGWVFFRSDSFHHAFAILRGMIGLNGIALPAINPPLCYQVLQLLGMDGMWHTCFLNSRVISATEAAAIGLLLVFVLKSPNTAQVMHRIRATLDLTDYRGRLDWRMNRGWAVITGVIFASCLLNLNRVSEFIYWQF